MGRVWRGAGPWLVKETVMSSNSSFLGMVAAAGVALVLAVGAAPAQARDVYWSVGVNSPGVAVGVSNGGYPAYVAPAPVYYVPPPPRPVYYAPPPPPPVYYTPPAPVYYAPPPGYYYRRHHHHHHHRDYDRWDR